MDNDLTQSVTQKHRHRQRGEKGEDVRLMLCGRIVDYYGDRHVRLVVFEKLKWEDEKR
jgi:hypothetical protein